VPALSVFSPALAKLVEDSAKGQPRAGGPDMADNDPNELLLDVVIQMLQNPAGGRRIWPWIMGR
jgi:hypothetical protein